MPPVILTQLILGRAWVSPRDSATQPDMGPTVSMGNLLFSEI